MKAIICEEPHKLALVSRSVPVPQAGEVLVRIRRVGLCGTDYHIFGGRHPYLNYPRVMGHELAGQVESASEGSAFHVGQVVGINPYLACGTCLACRHGKPNACANISVLGVHADGGMCELLAVPERAVIDAQGLSLDETALLEFLSIGAHAAARAGIRAGERVLVVGAGPIGVATGLFARLDGASVTLVDRRAVRLTYARETLGFPDVVEAGPDLAATLRDRTQGEFYDVVVDATGSIAAMNDALSYVGHGGRLVFVGVAPGTLQFEDPEFHKRETTIIASRNALAADFQRVIGALKSGAIRAADLQTHSVAGEDLPNRFPELIADADHILKAVASF